MKFLEKVLTTIIVAPCFIFTTLIYGATNSIRNDIKNIKKLNEIS